MRMTLMKKLRTFRNDEEGVTLRGGERLASRTVVWAAGEPSDEDVQAYWSALDEAIGDLRSEVGPVRHFRAVMSPRSLRLRERFSRRARTIGSSAAPVWRPVRRVGARVQRVVPQRKGDAE